MSLTPNQVETLKDNLEIGNIISWDRFAYKTTDSRAEVTDITDDNYVIAGEYRIRWEDVTWARRK